MERSTVKLAVVAPRPVPYGRGGAERHWDALVAELVRAGFDAELVMVDAPEANFLEVLESYRTFVELDVSGYDVVISGKYPSWMVRHPRHIRHLIHPLRGLYERYPAHLPEPAPSLRDGVARRLAADGPAGLIDWAVEFIGEDPESSSLPGPLARAVVQALDAHAAGHISVHAAMSEHVARRPGYLPPGAPVAIIPPLTDLDVSTVGEVAPSDPPPTIVDRSPKGGHFFAFGRLTAVKRFDLTIRAFARSGAAELRVAGTGPEQDRLAELAGETPGVVLLGECSDAELVEHLIGSIAVIATAQDEDYGLVAAEAMAAGRPVITTTDSGGLAEQVSHEVSGLVVPPFERSVAKAIRRLDRDRAAGDRLGRAGRDQIRALDWRPLVRLVDEQVSPRSPRRRVLMLSTFPAHPVQGGGARRLSSMASALHVDADVTVLTLTNTVGGTERRILVDGVVQVSVGRSRAHLKADAKMAALAGFPVDDLGCVVLGSATPAWAEILTDELSRTDAVVLAQPFLVTSLPADLDLPLVYDAYNVEVDLKAAMAKCRPGCGRLMEWAHRAEQEAMGRADVITATSEQDRDRLKELFGGRAGLIVPNGVDDALLVEPSATERSQARRRLLIDLGLGPEDERTIAVFIGSNHLPNHAAADLLSELAGRSQDLIIVLAGAHSERFRPHAHRVGRFSDAALRPLLFAADVALNPVAAGSGTNLKLIEALAAGVPVVASTVGARGLDDPDQVVTIADHDLDAAIRNISTDPATSSRVQAGRSVARRQTWHRAVAPLAAALGVAPGSPSPQ